MTVAQLRDWLRNWVAEATGLPTEQVTDDRPMEEFGLSSRDAVALSGEIEELVGVTLTATVAYQHPTIGALAQRIIEGEPIFAEESAESWERTDNGLVAHDIAIVGLSARFPGGANTAESVWEMLINGRDGIVALPQGRWSEFLGDAMVAEKIASANTWGGYLDDVKSFDAEFFSVSPLEASMIDPQQRLALELTWEAFEHARIPVNELKGHNVGVYVGTSTNDYGFLIAGDPTVAHPYGLTGAASSIIANRVSYFYDFRGPSVAVDTACSSSLVAVHQAVRALRAGEADVALAGGVNMIVAPAVTIAYDELGGALAPDGKIKAFSKDANGFIRAEGGGLVVLKRLVDARRDGDSILAVIAGTAVNSDGRSNGIAAPNPDAQVDVLRRAYHDAGIKPTDVDYVEAHGTGTILGDPIEAEAIGKVLGRGRAEDKPTLLGSAKTNFGHMESAAGAVGLIKVVLSLQQNKIPPSLNFSGPNPYIPFDQARLKVVEKSSDWPRYSGHAVAGVSGFGFGGTNAHVVVRELLPSDLLEESQDLEDGQKLEASVQTELDSQGLESSSVSHKSVALAVSAFVPSRRRAAAAELADWLESPAGRSSSLESVGRTLARRNHGRSRAIVLAQSHEEAIAGLRAVASGKPGPGVISADGPASNGPVWVFSGFGSQHRKMAKQLYLSNPVFTKAVDEVDALVVDEGGYSITEMLLDDAQDYGVETSQVGIFVIQVGLAAVLVHHGAKPTAVLGHSMGEVAAAYVSGGLSLEDAVRVIVSRSRLMGEAEATLTGDDIRLMALVEYSAEDITAVLADYPDLEVCVYAAPTHTVIGGPQNQVEAIVAQAESEGKLARVLQTKGASHTSQTDPLLGELAAELMGIEAKSPHVGIYSSVNQETYYRPGSDPVHEVGYWTKGLRHSVYFTNAVKLAVENGHTTFIELAPNPVALMQVAATVFAAGLNDPQLIFTLKRKEDEELTLLTALAQLYVHGHQVNLKTLFSDGEFAAVPRMTFQKKVHWIQAKLGGTSAARIPGAHVALPDGRHVWEFTSDVEVDLSELVKAAANQILSAATIVAVETKAVAPSGSSLVTTLQRHPGGASVQVHARSADQFQLLLDAVVTSDAVALKEDTSVIATVGGQSPVPTQLTGEELPEVIDSIGRKWDPEGSESIADRLAYIIAESMGYAPEDVPREIALIELGLDSLMAVRIKNRVEYEFDIPQLQLQAVRDANLNDVEVYVRYAIENRDEVAALAEKQQAEKEAERAAGIDSSAVATEPNSLVETKEELAEVEVAPEAVAQQNLPDQRELTEAAGGGVPPRDAAERLTFATWAVITGKSAGGIFTPLPVLDDDTAEKLAARLSERAKGEVTFDDILDSGTIEELANVVRPHLEGGEIEGLVRTLRARPEGSNEIPVFVFHPAGGSTVAYEPLLRRLPPTTPMYGFERVEGSIQERAKEYVPLLKEIQGKGPFVLIGWSLGGVLAYAVAKLLTDDGADVRFVGLIDTVMPGVKVEDTTEEIQARWQRYSAFAKKTYNVDYPLPYEKLAATDDNGQIRIIMDLLKMSGAKIPGGIIEHQRTSWLDNRAIQTAQPEIYDGAVTLYMADRYHDDAIALEPSLATRESHGGWGPYVENLEIVPIGGDHIAAIDEPYIGKVGAHLTTKLAEIEGK
ncbi:MAG: polyketide synthase Pks13 [Mycobacteriaceae bacterium]